MAVAVAVSVGTGVAITVSVGVVVGVAVAVFVGVAVAVWVGVGVGLGRTSTYEEMRAPKGWPLISVSWHVIYCTPGVTNSTVKVQLPSSATVVIPTTTPPIII